MAKSRQVALRFVEEFIDRDPEFLDVVEFADELYPGDAGDEVLYADIYDDVLKYLGRVRDRLTMMTED